MVLTGDQVALLNHLLDQALPLDKDGRKRWLQSLSPEYQSLVPALHQALWSDDPRASIAVLAGKPTIGDDPNAVTAMASGLRVGQWIGPYRLVRELGVGGMAVVWLAQRDDEASRREVALKLPLMSRLRRDLAGRFARECDILAKLEHPNIARMYDAGVSADGLPYLAMEYVQGKPITLWSDTHQLGLSERLELFLQVLDAVQYAHSLQVVHRDLKPSNLLVTDWGQVRLLDFGVAKILDEGQDALRTDLTQVYGRMLTPDYASPEQLMGTGLSAASDIYALGVVLYELLVGDRPYRIKPDSSAAPLQQAVKDAQIRRPSTQVQATAAASRATTREKLVRRLRGDLDTIALKALAKRPTERYASAVSFAADVRRYLSGDPIEAGADRPMVKFSRFLERHPFATATFVTLFAAAIELAIEHQDVLAPRFRQYVDALAARAATMLHHGAADEATKRPH
jgi:eukaryotic-like serine/threonine-protein kinase